MLEVARQHGWVSRPAARGRLARLALACLGAVAAGGAARAEALGPYPDRIPAAQTTPAQPPRAEAPSPGAQAQPPLVSSDAPSANTPVSATAPDEARPLGRANPVAPARKPDAGAALNRTPAAGATDWFARTAGALAIVLGLAFVLRGAVRRLASRAGLAGQLGAGGRAPSGVLEVLGRYPIARGQSLVLLRMDRRALLLSQSSAGFATLAEINDPDELASLLVQTRDEEAVSMSSRFSSLLRTFERDPSIIGEGVEEVGGPTSMRARLFGRTEDAPSSTRMRASTPEPDPVVSLRRRVALLRASA